MFRGIFKIRPHLVCDNDLHPKKREEFISKLLGDRHFPFDPDHVRAWAFAVAGDNPVGCLVYYPPHATSLWVEKDYQGVVSATDMITLLTSNVFKRFEDVKYIDALVIEEHDKAQRAFINAGWSRVGAVSRVGGRFIQFRKTK